jgi:hypothetical protein
LRRLVLLSLFLLWSWPGISAAAIPAVSYRVRATAGSWQPMTVADLAKTVEQATLEVLSKPGLMALRKDPAKSGPPSADYGLMIEGRLLDEAETFSVFLSFHGGTKSDLGSFEASETVSLKTKARQEILGRVEGAAKKAGATLIAALKPALERAARAPNASPGAAKEEPRKLPFSWGEVQIPDLRFSAGKVDLDAKSGEERAASLRLLTSLVLADDPGARNHLESCALGHKDPQLRRGCLAALAPASRRHPPTQRVVIEAYRKDKNGDVRKEAGEQMLYFTGPARKEAVQAWLESAARCEGSGPLDQLGDLPNLDLAVDRCLFECGKKPKYQRSKRSCIELMEPIPHRRRMAILWKYLQETNPDSPYYLEGGGASEGSRGTDWQWAAEKAIEQATRWDPAIEDIFWARYQRELSSFALDVLSDWAAPSPRLAGRLLEALQSGGDRGVLHGLQRIAKVVPETRPMIQEKLAELLHTRAYPKSIGENDLKNTLQALAKEAR